MKGVCNESMESEKIRGRERAQGHLGEREKERKRAAGVIGPQAKAASRTVRTRGEAVWGAAGRSEFIVRSPIIPDSLSRSFGQCGCGPKTQHQLHHVSDDLSKKIKSHILEWTRQNTDLIENQ